MKDEELAEEFYYKTYPITLNIGEEERKKEVTDIFLAGLKAGRPQYHDLQKNPNDLPEDTYDVLDQAGYKVHYNFFQNVWVNEKDEIDKNVIAWCEVPTFDKE